jgi:hypothetical protein
MKIMICKFLLRHGVIKFQTLYKLCKDMPLNKLK